jgi:hypothetical protein
MPGISIDTIIYNNFGEDSCPTTARFNGIYSDYGVDTDFDGQYEYLAIRVGIDIKKSNIYNVSGMLYDDSGHFLDLKYSENSLNFGSRNIFLDFSRLINASPGRYYLKNLTLYDENQNTLDYVLDAYTTHQYEYFDVQLSKFNNNFSDYGTDFNGDGLYDWLTIEAGIDVISPEELTLQGYLYDINGSKIDWAITSKKFDKNGLYKLYLDFDGRNIQKKKIDGPYYVRELMLSGKNWSFIDDIPEYTTNIYNYMDFGSTT